MGASLRCVWQHLLPKLTKRTSMSSPLMLVEVGSKEISCSLSTQVWLAWTLTSPQLASQLWQMRRKAVLLVRMLVVAKQLDVAKQLEVAAKQLDGVAKQLGAEVAKDDEVARGLVLCIHPARDHQE